MGIGYRELADRLRIDIQGGTYPPESLPKLDEIAAVVVTSNWSAKPWPC